MSKVLVTGSAGLIGTALAEVLERDVEVVPFDRTADPAQELADQTAVLDAVEGCEGIVHLGALSRVVWGEQRPEECHASNVVGTANVVEAAVRSGAWLISASSREVYGQQDTFPVAEDAPHRPCNTYGRSKEAGEAIVRVARSCGLRATVVRFSNVYGSIYDHADRVVPAFARAALRGEALRVEGSEHVFDFTYVHDVVHGVAALVRLLRSGAPAPAPIHYVSGRATTLGVLAEMIVKMAGSKSEVREAAPRSYDVHAFVGDPSCAREVLGWECTTPLRDGLEQYLRDLRTAGVGSEE